MLKNYFTIALRTLLKNKAVAFINIFGLAVGIASFILIFFYVKDELNYDRHWEGTERIYRVNQVIHLPDKTDPFGLTSIMFAPSVKEEVTGIESIARLYLVGLQTVWVDGKMFDVNEQFFADPEIFSVFDYCFLSGNPKTALKEPQTVVISKNMAEKLFGSTDVIGKMIRYARLTYKVTGVFDPKNKPSHLRPEAFLSIASINPLILQDAKDDWFRMNTYTYVKLAPGSSEQQLYKRLQVWNTRHIVPWIKQFKLNDWVDYQLLPIADIHFDTYYIYDHSEKGNLKYVYVFSCVAVFLLLIGCFNYMNLATAYSANRFKEVGMRKVVGATRRQIIGQFLSESILTALLALALSLLLIEILSPGFEHVTGKKLGTIYSLLDAQFWCVALGVIVFIGIIGGSYPAFYLSRFNAVSVLKSRTVANKSLSIVMLRKLLVVAQFAISISLITATLIISLQLHFMKTKNLGIDINDVAVLSYPAGDTLVRKQMGSIRNSLTANSLIKGFATAEHLPGERTGRLLFFFGDSLGKEQALNITFANEDYFKLLGIKAKQGRLFSEHFPSDTSESFVINEAAVRFLGFSNPIGKIMDSGLMKGKIIGVVPDYHYASLQNKIEPMVFLPLKRNQGGYILLKFQKGNTKQVVSFIEHEWKKHFPKNPVSYTFLEDDFNKQYAKEKTMIQVFGYFSGLTIFISCLGLLGLSYFTTQQRIKEIGIRKVLGASSIQIALHISKDFALLVLISIVLGIPFTFFAMQKWLQDFAYRIDVTWVPFVIAGLASMLVAILTVGSISLKAANRNPLPALKYE